MLGITRPASRSSLAKSKPHADSAIGSQVLHSERLTMATSLAHDNDHGHYHPSGLMRWVTTTNHKDIGTLYLWFSFTMFLVGGMLALAIRAELFRPGLQFWRPEFFNQLTTMHGLIMVFGAIMPAFVGFAN